MNKFETLDDRQLIRRISRECHRSFNVFMKRWEEKLTVFLKGKFSNIPHEQLQDTVQDTFLKVYRSAGTYRNGDAKVSTWLYTIAINTVYSWYKKSSKIRATSIFEYEEDGYNPIQLVCKNRLADREMESQDLVKAVDRALPKLPKEYRDALILRTMYDLRYDTISEMLGIPIGTVKSRINRGRDMMNSYVDFSI